MTDPPFAPNLPLYKGRSELMSAVDVEPSSTKLRLLSNDAGFNCYDEKRTYKIKFFAALKQENSEILTCAHVPLNRHFAKPDAWRRHDLLHRCKWLVARCSDQLQFPC